MKKQPKYVLRKIVNRTPILPCGFKEHFTWDIYLEDGDGMEYIGEFAFEFKGLAQKIVRLLNKEAP